MKLFYREYGEGEPIIIAHGLFGMSDNWMRIAKALATDYKIYLPDMRNHGKSPHSPIHNFDVMSDDLLEFIDDKQIEKATLIGHSMGGKTVLQFAENHPERVKNLIIVDISPRAYTKNDSFFKNALNHQLLLKTMRKTEINKAKNRIELVELLRSNFKNEFLLQLVQKNIIKDTDKQYKWKINIDTLYSNLSEMQNEIRLSENVKNIRPLFIFGEHSPYFILDDKKLIKALFPKAQIIIIQRAGHLIHVENEADFLHAIRTFMN